MQAQASWETPKQYLNTAVTLLIRLYLLFMSLKNNYLSKFMTASWEQVAKHYIKIQWLSALRVLLLHHSSMRSALDIKQC
jgi:hypothetical protein